MTLGSTAGREDMGMFRVLLVAGSLAAMAAAAAGAVAPDGKALYETKCALCHGKEGVPPPPFAKLKAPSFSDAAWHKTKTDDQIRKSVLLGVKSTMMKAFEKEMSAAEVDAVVKYVRTLAAAKK
jgi:mono/diheme cytochrome c family protein